jgi:diguanylate cyclase (GGDEF)-like protein
VHTNRGNKTIRHLLETAEGATVSFRIVASLVLLVAVATADWLTGFEYSFASMYLMPVVAAAWFVGPVFARLLSVASAGVWFSLNFEAEKGSSPGVAAWNIGIRLALYLFVAMLVGAAHSLLESERYRSRIDDLTGILNFRAFHEEMTREVQRMRRTNRPLSVAYIDLDDFKETNDRFGHAAGDEFLRSFAHCAMQTIRTLDSMARLGGDEFAILMPETDREGAAAAVARFRDHMSAMGSTPIGFSMGVVTCDPPEPVSADAILQRADTLMYTAKRLGKNRYVHACFSDAGDVFPPPPAKTASRL